ncbi:mating-type alpha-pheromone receptor PreB [Diplocarpon rosae]|nr:mating-type alpha-pheromone receptor PreB [Diplocarpon rosae]
MSSPNSTFDYKGQSVTFLLRDGVTPIVVPISDIDDLYLYLARIAINYGSQLGACFVMFVVTVILSKETKRRTPVYVLNLLSLALGFLRALLLALYTTSSWVEFYDYFAFDFADISRSAYATSIAGAVIPLLMTVTVNTSLFLQAHTVCKVMERKYLLVISCFSGLIFMLAIGFRFAQTITNSMAIMSAGNYFYQAWITTGCLATETISIWYYSIIFTWKLLWTVHARKNLGFQKWSYIQILAAMGGCTMIIPSGFAILEYANPDGFPVAGTLALTMVALLLPLSSLWASMVTTEATSSFNVSQLWRSRSSQGDLSFGRKTYGSDSTGLSSSFSERKGSAAPIGTSTVNNIIEHAPVKSARDSTELDLEMMGVRVDRSYRSDTPTKRRGRLSRHTQSIGSHQYQQGPTSGSTDTSPRNKNKILYSPSGGSFSLVSLVSKFEALDALSLPFAIPALQPAPLHISRNQSWRRGDTGSNCKRKLSTIFSPRSESLDRHDSAFSEDETRPARPDMLGASNYRARGTLEKQNNVGKFDKAQDGQKPSSIMPRGATWDPGPTARSKAVGVVIAPHAQNETLDDNRLRDKIRFFDGTVSTGGNTQAKPSANNTPIVNTPFSLARTWSRDKEYLLTPSTASSRRACVRKQAAFTPTKAGKKSLSSGAHLDSGSTPSLLHTRSSPSKYTPSNTSPRATQGVIQHGNVEEPSPRMLFARRRRQNAPVPVLALGGDGTAPLFGSIQDEGSMPLSRRRLSNKISELYSAKSLEKQPDNKQKAAEQESALPSIASSQTGLEHEELNSGAAKNSERRYSRVAAMRKIFDHNLAARSPPSKATLLDAQPDFQQIFPSRQQGLPKPKPITVQPPPPTPLPLPVPKDRRESAPAPGTVSTLPKVTKTWPSQSSSPTKKLPQPKSKVIGDKLKIFEAIPQNTDNAEQSSRRSIFRRRLSKSLRSLFEPPVRKSQEEAEEGKLNIPVGKPPKEKRVVSPDGNGVIGKRNAVVGRWNSFSPAPVASGIDGTMSQRQSVSQVKEGIAETVVKGVDCGLEEPRPVRAIEMRRMSLLCRDRAGDIVDNQRGRRAGQSTGKRKL